jgi:hypothetical protein
MIIKKINGIHAYNHEVVELIEKLEVYYIKNILFPIGHLVGVRSCYPTEAEEEKQENGSIN